MSICAISIAIGLGAGVPTAAGASVVDSYCNPTGDYCTGVIKQDRRIKLKISTFSFRGSYGLCVRTPNRRTRCHHFRLHRHRGDIYEDGVDFAKHFPHRQTGRYTVTWHKFGNRLGKPLHFPYG